MRILQIYELNPVESIGGVESAIFQISKELVKLGHKVTILTGAGKKTSVDSRDGIDIINFDIFGIMRHTYCSGSLTLFRQLLFLSSIIAKKLDLCFDIYHGHIYTSGLLANYLARKNHGIAVNTIHGSYYPVWDQLTNPLSASFYKTMEKYLATFLAKRSDQQIHVSTYFARQVSEWGGIVKVIPNGVDTGIFYPGLKGNFSSSVPIILSARRLVRKNGLEYLIRSMALLKEECKLLIIGDGPERRRLEVLAKKTPGNIEFLGAVSYENMPHYIALADIAVVPSIIEASSLFMLEAMAMGKPVVASAVGGLPEILGDTGILVPSMDPERLAGEIRGFLHDPEKRRDYGWKARKRVEERYTWKKITRQIEKEYKNLWSAKNE
jgi:glycosyltransferase involved in cell wall biosynthesis